MKKYPIDDFSNIEQKQTNYLLCIKKLRKL